MQKLEGRMPNRGEGQNHPKPLASHVLGRGLRAFRKAIYIAGAMERQKEAGRTRKAEVSRGKRAWLRRPWREPGCSGRVACSELRSGGWPAVNSCGWYCQGAHLGRTTRVRPSLGAAASANSGVSQSSNRRVGRSLLRPGKACEKPGWRIHAWVSAAEAN